MSDVSLPAAGVDTGSGSLRAPWVTWALLAVLGGAFLLQLMFSIGDDASKFDISVQALIAMGGLNRSLVLDHGQWYRLFTAPLLHANAIHFLLNGFVLVLIGRALERMVGHAWFLALYALGGLGGALMSLTLNSVTLTSVGASGAIMGLCAATLVAAYHLPEGQARKRVLSLGARLLIPSLIPVASTGSGMQVDFGAHLGGALAGGAAAGLLLLVWPPERRLPPGPPVARTIAVAGVLLSMAAAIQAVATYPAFDTLAHLMPETEMPRGGEQISTRAGDLLAKYPKDPRSHYYQAIALVRKGDAAGAETELRLGLSLAEPHERYYFGSEFVENMRGLLALDLIDLERREEAKEVAIPLCRAHAAPGGSGILESIFEQHLCD